MASEDRSGVVHDRDGPAARLNAWRKRSIFSPYYLDWRYLRVATEGLAEHARGVLLDVGTSEGPYRDLFEPHVTSYLGLEYPPSILDKRPDMWRILGRVKRSVDVFGDGNRLPFTSESVDTVLSTEVLEHLPDPNRCLSEVSRVLKSGGRLLATVPFVQPLHELPHDYHRFTPSALRSMMQKAGLEVERIEARGDFAAACGSLCCQFLLGGLGARGMQSDGSVLPSAWRNLLLAPIYALVQGASLILSRLSSDDRVTLGYTLVARKP